MQIRLMQTKTYATSFLLSLNKISKAVAGKHFFSNVYVIGTTCFDL